MQTTVTAAGSKETTANKSDLKKMRDVLAMAKHCENNIDELGEDGGIAADCLSRIISHFDGAPASGTEKGANQT
jgi:hypothetical protein